MSILHHKVAVLVHEELRGVGSLDVFVVGKDTQPDHTHEPLSLKSVLKDADVHQVVGPLGFILHYGLLCGICNYLIACNKERVERDQELLVLFMSIALWGPCVPLAAAPAS